MTRIFDTPILVMAAGVVLGYALLCGSQGANGWLWAGAVFVPLAGFALTHSLSTSGRLLLPMFLVPLCIGIQLVPSPVRSVAPSVTALELTRVIVYLAVFLILRESAVKHSGSDWLLLILPLLFGCIEAAIGVLQHNRQGTDNLSVGTFANHSHFAGFLAMLLPVATAFAVSQRQLLAYSVPLVMFAALLCSFSRMGFAASMVAIVSMVLIRTRQIKFAAAVTAVVVLSAIILSPSGWNSRFQKLATFEGLSHDAEFGLWHDTLKLISARPLLGSGAGTYEIAFAPYDSSPKGWPVYHADNDYLELLSELGILGTLAVLALFAAALALCFHASRSNLVALGCTASIIALLTHSLFEFQLHIPANVLAVCWIAGVGCGIAGRNKNIVQKSWRQSERLFGRKNRSEAQNSSAFCPHLTFDCRRRA